MVQKGRKYCLKGSKGKRGIKRLLFAEKGAREGGAIKLQKIA